MMPKRMQPMGRLDVVSHFPAAPGTEIHCVKVQTEWAVFQPRYVKIEPAVGKWFDVLQIYVNRRPMIPGQAIPAEVFSIPAPLDLGLCIKDETIEVRLRNKDVEPHMITVTFLGKYTEDNTPVVRRGAQ